MFGSLHFCIIWFWVFICIKLHTLKAIQHVNEFVSSSEHIRINLALHHLLNNESSVVNGCRQSEYSNGTIIHKYPHDFSPSTVK